MDHNSARLHDDHADRLQTRIQNFLKLSTVNLIDDTNHTQMLQLSSLNKADTHNSILSMSQFGFSSSPPPGSRCLALSVAGDNSQKYAIATHNTVYRPKNLSQGETQLHDAQNQKVYLQANGTLALVANNKVTVTVAGNNILTATVGSLYVNGNLVPSTGWTGTVTAPDGRTITITSGIITNVQ